jgi:integrase
VPSATAAHKDGEAHDHRIALLPAVRAISGGSARRRQLVDDVDPARDFHGARSQLLASIDRRTAVGRRDYAILLMLARLGLRTGEVVSLDLGDIDWNLGQVNVCGKSGQRNRLPLTTEVGKAIAAYLQRGRPHSTSRRVFLRARAPICAFRGVSGIDSAKRRRKPISGTEYQPFRNQCCET